MAERANAYRLSFERGCVVQTNSALTLADGLAVRIPDPDALDFIRKGAERIVEVSEDEIAEAIRNLYTDTHNLVEGAGAAPFAALMKEHNQNQNLKAAIILSGQNIDQSLMHTILSGVTPGLTCDA